MWHKTILCLIQIQLLLAQDVTVGDSCIPNRNYAEGTCSLVTDCDVAVKQIKVKRGHDFNRCGFDGKIEIVCCPRLTDSRFGTSSTKRPQTNSALRIADRECEKIMKAFIIALDLHILGGEEASLGEFPHMPTYLRLLLNIGLPQYSMLKHLLKGADAFFYRTKELRYFLSDLNGLKVALGYDRQTGGFVFDCGGSVISKDYVLTAAHCVDTLDRIEPTVVRTGIVELGEDKWDDDTDVGIAQIIKHPEYTRKEKYHDLALLRLSKSLSFASNLNAACLETSNKDPTLPLLITGWGQTSNTRDAKSKILLKATVSAVSSEKCGESYVNWRKLPQGIVERQMCAGDPKGIKDTCQGDSGGPLQTLSRENVYKVVGITSFGRGCGSPVPGVYTRVAMYLDWIESIVWPH